MSERAGEVRAEFDDDGVVRVVFDRPGEGVNVLASGVLTALDRILDTLAGRTQTRGVLFVSAKSGSFLAGVDVEDIASFEDAFAAAEAARFGQGVFQKIAALPVPSAVAIEGACMGGGTELALACSMRFAADTTATRLGLPETRIGIVPGFGGCQRLPRLVGLSAALDLILSGRSVDAHEALRIGLVDVVCPPELLEREARAALLAGRVTPTGATRRPQRALERVVESVPALRRQALERARRDLEGRVRPEVHPAPYRALEAIEAAYSLPLHAGLDVEARLIGELVPSRTTKNLIWLFKSRNALRRGATTARPREIRKVSILGAGRFGAELARRAAEAELSVRLHDPQPEALLEAMRVARGHWDESLAHDRLGWISPTRDLTGLARADIVVETLAQDLEGRRLAIADLEPHLDERAVIAVQTPCLPVSEIAAGAIRPERVVGVHFVRPIEDTRVTEIIAGSRTSPEAVSTAIDLTRKLGRIPIEVGDRPGFLMSRVQFLYFAEAIRLHEEGVALSTVDEAARAYGMSEGPFERLDRIGLEEAARIAAVLTAAFGRRVEGLLTALHAKVAAGMGGAVSGRGFYRWSEGRRGRPVRSKSQGQGSGLSLETVQERLMLTLINDCAAILDDGVVRSARDLDVAMVLGAGFPAHRGGPLHEADAIGLAVVADRLSRLSEALGERFRPAAILRTMVREDRRFHPATSSRTVIRPRGADV